MAQATTAASRQLQNKTKQVTCDDDMMSTKKGYRNREESLWSF
jgi:hypothetical protein